jgi:hypothetical protein
MLYSDIVKKRIRQSFDHLNNRRWDEVLKAVAPNVHTSAGSSPLSISRSTTSG